MRNRKTVIDALILLNRIEFLLLRKAKPFLSGEYGILAVLEGQGGKRTSDLSEMFNTALSRASRYVNNLENRGLIQRKLGKKDLREFHFYITEKGREKLRELDDLLEHGEMSARSRH